MNTHNLFRLSWGLSMVALFVAIPGLSPLQGRSLSKRTTPDSAQTKQTQKANYYGCPMHSDVKSDQPGKCAKCGMDLLPRTGNETPLKARISLTTEPATIKQGEPFLAQMKVTDENGAPVQQFDIVHEKLLHLIIVSRDLKYFDHVHPTLVGNTFSIKTSVPKPGDYRMFADFVPKGGSQTIGRLDFTAQGTPTPEPLKPDASFTKTFGSVEVTLSPSTFKAGESVALNFTLKDAQTGKAIQTLRPYLGAMGHCVTIDQTAAEYLHSHPLEGGESPQGNEGMEHSAGHHEHHHHGPAKRFGGPEVSFHTQFPKPGIYKTWGQFNYQGKILVADFVFEVK